MPETTLNELLEAMPNIAKAVNAFTSDAVQQRAFTILMNALGVEHQEKVEDEHTASRKPTRLVKRADKDAKTRKTPTGPPRLEPGLNLRPASEKSLRDFVEEKKPRSNEERFAVVIFYMEKILQEKQVGRNHVYTAFKELGTKAPLDIDAALRMTAIRKGWIDNSDVSDLRMTVHGENFVEHDLPRKDGGNS